MATLNDSEFEELELPPGGDDEPDRSPTAQTSPPSASTSPLNKWKKVASEGLIIPFSRIHEETRSFKDTSLRPCFIPGKPVHVKIIDVEKTPNATHFLNANLYVIQLQHGDHTWVVRRRYKHFQHLHQQLMIYRVTLSVPFPSRTHRERRVTYKNQTRSESSPGAAVSGGLPRFPRRPEALVASDHLQERKDALEEYLKNLLDIRAFRNHHETMEFLEVSPYSFIQDLGPKGKESLVLKRTGTATGRNRKCGCGFHGFCSCFQKLCGVWCGQWQRRWLIVKDTWIGYVRPKDGKLHCVMLFDNEFEVSSAMADVEHGIMLSNSTRHLVVKCWTKRKSKEWVDYLRKVMATETAQCFIKENRFLSFAPLRSGTPALWFVDGAEYMRTVADAMEAAQEEIFISDWWLSPEIYMKRPMIEGEHWRLDNILRRKAKQGVKVFVLLYKEVSMALGINSYYSKQTLVQACPNIKVLRHPDHASAGVLLWAHHEKLVIVDQSYAFVGGIDLCYGRWDDHNHRLTDLGSVSVTTHYGMKLKITSSQPTGAANASLLQLAKATNMLTFGTMSGRQQQEREDATPIEMVNGGHETLEAGANVAFVAETEVGIEIEAPTDDGAGDADISGNAEPTPLKGETPPTGRRARLIRKMTTAKSAIKSEGKEWIGKIRRTHSHSSSDESDQNEEGKEGGKRLRSRFRMRRKKSDAQAKPATPAQPPAEPVVPELKGSSKLWMGKDYTNFIVKDFADLHSPFTDLVDRSTTPRMPWHDIAVYVEGAAARDVARHFIQRWNATKAEKAQVHVNYPFLLPKSYDFSHSHRTFHPKMKFSKTLSQVIRSATTWSTGISNTEDSIHQAYIDAIQKAKHYVYIENQFFVTLAGENIDVLNRIGEALFHRILQAHRENSQFRVFVVIPLLPGFEGEVGTSRGVAIHAIVHWNYSSICRGPNSLFEKLKQHGVEDPEKYITFHGLRTWSELHGDLVTELIYVHSKLLIADDNLVICGSANINDRSMLGKRDSEVAVIIQDEEFVSSRMNQKEYKAGKFGLSLRLRLFREHLGLFDKPEVDIRDIVNEDFYEGTWRKTAKTNTRIYDEVFNVMPTDNCTTFAEFQSVQSKHALADKDPNQARKLLKDVNGYLVDLPLQFLCKENLLPPSGTGEALMPIKLWT